MHARSLFIDFCIGAGNSPIPLNLRVSNWPERHADCHTIFLLYVSAQFSDAVTDKNSKRSPGWVLDCSIAPTGSSSTECAVKHAEIFQGLRFARTFFTR